MFARPARGFLVVSSLAAALSLTPSCAPAEHVLLLEVRSQADVDTLHIEIIDLAGDGPPTERMQRVNRSRDSINNEEPIRVAVTFPGPADVVVYVRASSRDTPPRTLLATRCYTIAGVVRDDVLLVQLDASVDEDGDGFPRQATATCRDLSPTGTVEACDIGACDDAIAADCDDNPSDDPAGASEERLNRAVDRYPGAPYFCMDEVDQNCRIDDPSLPDGDEPCRDRDDDEWQACSFESSMGLCDCDDTNPLVNPDQTDECGDGIDSDCSGAEALCDNDMDGVPADRPVGGAPDCDDTNPAVSPRAAEDCGNTIDDNCNLLVNEGCSDGDLDNDGDAACPPGVTSCTTCDCNDCNGAVHPGAREICDGIDNITGAASADCPGDVDRDGYLDPIDCLEGNDHVFQNAPEHCGDATSENCIDLPMMCSEGVDADGDGYTTGTRGQDCNDTTASIAPWVTELCNDVDDDCDGIVNEHGRALDDGGCVFDPRVCPPCTTDDECAPERCIGGICGGACEVEFRAMTGSIDHCGGCGLSCNTAGATFVANTCLSGVCDCSSEAGTASCDVGDTCCTIGANQGCDDLDSSPLNCGLCGMECNRVLAPDCNGGDCTCNGEGAPCVAGLACCGGAGCVDLAADPLNCGFCGHVCGTGSSCNAGSCTCDNSDTFDCNGDLGMATNDGCEARIDQVNRCGSCGLNCMTLANVATATCGGSPGARACVITGCVAGFGDCNAPRTDDGCETSTRTVTNCNACGVSCNLPNTVETCATGTCAVGSCDAGFADCSGAPGCETPLRTLTDCTGCGMTCSLPNASESCASGTCAVTTCDAGFADCTGAPGCETPLRTLTDCTGCGMACNLPNATESCTSGTCTLTACDATFADCTGAPGCETPLRTLSDCTGCGVTCSFLNAAESCTSGTCMMGTCDAGFGDCTAAAGCETSTRTVTNCNGCGVTCTLPNAVETCATGTCAVASCDAGFADCSGGAGCETPLRTLTDCTGCGVACNLPHATESCSTGTCVVTSCDSGWADCTGAPGCETDITTTSNCGACGSVCGNDMGPNDQAETCEEGPAGAWHCDCRGTTAPGAGQACSAAGEECCQSGSDCRGSC